MEGLLLLTLCLSSALAQVDVLGPEYLALPAAEKQAIIWDNALMDSSSGQWPGLSLAEIFFESMCPTMEAPGDQMPIAWTGNPRKKYIHSIGSIGKVEFVSTGNSYTGLFQGSSYGIVRISLAGQPSPDVLNTAPGMGFKLLRDGMESASLVAMYGVDGQESWNVFANEWSNHLAAAEGAAVLALAAKFATATPNIQQVGLSDFSKYGEDGVTIPDFDINYPYELIFKPTGEITFPDEYHGLFTDDLASIAEGSVLWNVYAMNAPVELGGQQELIGNVVLTSPLVTSLWGDQHLFFRHQDMREDFILHPEWDQYTEVFGGGLIPTEC